MTTYVSTQISAIEAQHIYRWNIRVAVWALQNTRHALFFKIIKEERAADCDMLHMLQYGYVKRKSVLYVAVGNDFSTVNQLGRKLSELVPQLSVVEHSFT